jgi:hypothetical protein
MMNPTIRVELHGATELRLDEDEQREVHADASGFEVDWAEREPPPPVMRGRVMRSFGLEGVALVFLGAASGGLAQAIGDDVWKGVKHLVARIWSKRAGKAYRVKNRAQLVLDLDDERKIVLELSSPFTVLKDGLPVFEEGGITPVSVQEMERLLESQRQRITASWGEIVQAVDRQRTSERGPADQVLWVRMTERGPSVVDVKKLSYFRHLP